ncbi:hypothetical protein BDS110ZK25_53370 [Bradyrhizobium diazoefficiens]
MIDPARIEQALTFLDGWHRCYAELVDSVPTSGRRRPSAHNVKSRDEYRNAIEVIKALQSLARLG